MKKAHYLNANGLNICYDEFGNKQHPAIILVMGLGSQMIQWPEDFCIELASHGYRVIRFDNRDIGLSEKIDPPLRAPILRLMFRQALSLPVPTPYTLHDMAEDAVGVLDALDISAAHWVGVSMGGMISQIVAANYPARCLSLSSIMSSSGNPRLPQASIAIRLRLLKTPPLDNEEAYVEHMLVTRKMFDSPGFRMSDDELRRRILMSYRRNYYPQGYRNQVGAIIATGDRRSLLKQIQTPTLVVHGHDDALVPVAAGIDTAKHIPLANMHLIKGMGHDLAPGVCERLVPLIDEHAQRAVAKANAA